MAFVCPDQIGWAGNQGWRGPCQKRDIRTGALFGVTPFRTFINPSDQDGIHINFNHGTGTEPTWTTDRANSRGRLLNRGVWASSNFPSRWMATLWPNVLSWELLAVRKRFCRNLEQLQPTDFKWLDRLREDLLDNVHLNFDSEAQWVLNIALALVMFGIALEISVDDFKGLFHKPKIILTGVCSQFILLPAITFLLVLSIDPMASMALGMFMVAACPGGNVSNFITHLAGGNTALSVSLTAIATLLAVVMTPLNLQFWGSLYPPTASILKEIAISPLEMVKLVSLLLGLPLLLGMWINHHWPILAKKMGKVLKMVSLVFFVALIFLALYNNRAVFVDYVFYVLWIVILHNLLAFATGFSFARLLGLSQKDIRSITIETGIQNSGLGLLLIFAFFEGLGGMALLAAFWGIWHLVSGLILAAIWGHRPLKKEKLA